MIKAVLAIWMVVITASLIGWGGWGVSLLSGFRSQPEGGRQLPYLLLIGLFFVTLQGLVVNFWLPLTAYAGVYSLSAGLVLLFCYRKCLVAQGLQWSLLVAAVVWVAWGLPFDSLFNDAGGYHLQFEQWIAHSRLLWGLANIQTRFGFDSTWLIFVSATRIDLSPTLSPWMHAIAADMMIRAFVFWWLLIGFNTSLKSGDRFGQVFYGFGFLLLSVLLWRMREAGTDNPANLIAIGLWLIAYEAWQGRGRSLSIQQGIAAIASVALVCTSKLSILPLTLLVVPVLLVLRTYWKQLVPVAIAAFALIGCWIFRNFVLTGCFIYPAALTCVDVPWGLGAEVAKVETWNVTAFARTHMGPGIILKRSMESVTNFSFEWLGEWLKHFPSTYYFRVTVVAFFLGLTGWLVWGRRQRGESWAGFLLFSVMVVGVEFVYWLLLGPDPRFAWSMFYIASVASICWIWGRFGKVRTFDAEVVRAGVVPSLVIVMGLLVGAIHQNPIDPYKFSHYEWTSFKYRDVEFYFGPNGDCGERMPCVVGPGNVLALDKVLSANPGSAIFYPR